MNIDLDDRFWSKVAKTEDCWNWTACTYKGYGMFNVNGKPKRAHRLSYVFYYNEDITNKQIDHICRNRKCVNPKHLRACNNKQNAENVGSHKDSKYSNYRGVSFNKRKGKWIAQVTHNYKNYGVGYFDDELEAAEAARLKRQELFTHNGE